MLIPPSKKILFSPFLVSKKKKQSAFSFPQQDALNMPVQNAAQRKLNRIHFIYACPECSSEEPQQDTLYICLSRIQHKRTSTGYTLYACPECSTKETQQDTLYICLSRMQLRGTSTRYTLYLPVQNTAQKNLNRIHFICLSRMQHKGTSTGYTLYACPECSTKEPQQLILPFLGTPTPIKSPGMNSFFRPQTINIYGRQSAWSGIKRKLTILPSQSSWTQNAFVHFSVVFQIQMWC